MTAAIEMVNVTRFYEEKRGVKSLNLTVPTGSILGLLGENGSGKTTAMKLAMGDLFPNDGHIKTLGVDPVRIKPETRARIGWLTDAYGVPSRMNLQAAMNFQSAYFPTWDQTLATDLAHQFELKTTSIFGSLSLGQRRRFMLLLVLAQTPELLVLDEPAGNLDSAVRRQLIDILLHQVAQREITIVLSSHILSDVERLVDTVAFMKDGAVVCQSELEILRARVKRLCITRSNDESEVRSRFNVLQADTSGGMVRLVVSDFEPERVSGLELTVEHLNLEELFLVYNAPQGPNLSLVGAER